jgi:cytochrome P450
MDAAAARSTGRILRAARHAEHRDYRRLLSGHFTPRAVEMKRAAVERLIDELLDGLGDRTEIDFVTDVAAVLPIVVIAEMLGLPVEDRPLFFRWTNETLGATDPEYQQGATVHETTARAVQAQMDYFMRMVELRRRHPTDDFMGILANAKLDGAWIPDFELLSYLILLVVAGNETTRNAASGGCSPSFKIRRSWRSSNALRNSCDRQPRKSFAG